MPAPKYLPHYTLLDYQQWEGTWELWNGVAVAMTPSPFGKHQKSLAKLAFQMLKSLEISPCSECEVAVELDWVISEDTVVRPDLSVCCGGNTDRFIEQPPTLVAEVLSTGTEKKDRTAKRELYEKQGVKYYLLVDTDNGHVEMLGLCEGQYQTVGPGPVYNLDLGGSCKVKLDLTGLV